MPTYKITFGEKKYKVTANSEAEAMAGFRSQMGLDSQEDTDTQKEDPTTWENLSYAYDEAVGFGAGIRDYINSVLPLGSIGFDFTDGFTYYSPDHRYGEGYSEASPEERREMIMAYRAKLLKEEYGEDFVPDRDSWAYTIGGLGGAIADPTSLLPMGATWKGATAIGGALGFGASATDDLRQNKEVDLTKAAISTGAGAVLAGGTKLGLDKLIQRSASKVVNKVNAKLDERNASGIDTIAEDIPMIAAELGYSPAKVSRAYRTLGENPYARTVDLSEKAATKAITEDSAVSRIHSKGLDDFLGILSTQVRNISEPIYNKLREFELGIHVNTQNRLLDIQDFAENLHKSLTPRQHRDVSIHLSNGRFNEVSKILKNHAEDITVRDGILKTRTINMSDSFDKVKNVLTDLGKGLDEVGYKIGMPDTFVGKLLQEKYFPRQVKDYEGLLNALGGERKGFYEQQLKAYANKKGISVEAVKNDTATRDEILNQAVRGYAVDTSGHVPRFVKKRKLDNVTDDLLDFYGTPAESLQSYVRGATNAIERGKFFGKSIDLEENGSIGAWLSKELPDIKPDDQLKLQELLKSRFISGEQTGDEWSKLLKDTGYAGTIANPIAAVTQIGDVGIAAYKSGIFPTIQAALRMPFSKKSAKLIDIGLDNTISQEMGNPSKFANGLQKLFKASGFAHIDKFGKQTIINAALIKAQKQARSTKLTSEGKLKGVEKLKEKWGTVFGDEMDTLIDDLRAGNMTDNVKLLMWNELSDVQPVSLSEMPKKYLDNPNGRLMYMLKSFTLKQVDVVRRDIVQQAAKKGGRNKAIAAGRMGKLAFFLGSTNMATGVVKDMLLGKDIDVDEIPERMVWSYLGVYGMGKWGASKFVEDGKLLDRAADMITPAAPLIDAAVGASVEAGKDDPDFSKQLKSVPLVGPMMYYWFLGGAEKYNEKRKKEKYNL